MTFLRRHVYLRAGRGRHLCRRPVWFLTTVGTRAIRFESENLFEASCLSAEKGAALIGRRPPPGNVLQAGAARGISIPLASATATTAAATATATEITTRAAAPATARSALLFRPRDVDSKVSAVQGRAVHSFDGLLSLFGCAHGDEGEPARPAAHTVDHQVRFDDGAVCGKRVVQGILCSVEGKISYKQFRVHRDAFYSVLD